MFQSYVVTNYKSSNNSISNKNSHESPYHKSHKTLLEERNCYVLTISYFLCFSGVSIFYIL